MPTALITGASAGIGRAFAEALSSQGYDLVLVARREDRLHDVAAETSVEHGGKAELVFADLASEQGAALVERRILEGDPLDMVINNAGFAVRAPIGQCDYQALEDMFKVNMFAVARLSNAAMNRMKAIGHGTIINVASGTIFGQMPGNAGYGASKAFVASLTRHMQAEAAGSGITVQLLVPGVVATEFHDVAGTDLSRLPPDIIMQADELVAASLAAVEMGETICIPSLPDISDWETYVSAERGLMQDVSRRHPADRYALRAT
jgi:short-subunit dehydrogenase